MQLVKGDLWDELGKADVLLVTTNSTVKRNGELVMGRGAAAEAKARYPEMPKRLGDWARQFPDYLLYLTHNDGPTSIGAFQVKHDWRGPAGFGLIQAAVDRLGSYARTLPNWRFALNFPGIGNGGLTREDVLPIIEQLPDNVYVYEM